MDYGDVTPRFVTSMAPSMVLSSVITPAFDAFDLAQLLVDSGYAGPYRALTPRLPDPDLVRREVAACAPQLDFELMIVGDEMRGGAGH